MKFANVFCRGNFPLYGIALVKANNEYATKQQEGVSTEKLMMNLAWNVKDLNDLNDCGRKVIQECDIIKRRLDDCSYDRISNNFAKKNFYAL